MHDLIVSRRFVSHVVKRHKDWIEMLGLETGEEITNFIMQVLKNPDKIYKDKIRDDVTYFLKRLDSYFLCVVVVGKIAVTAYLINQEKYDKYRKNRWVER
jgi:hypothetical protein